MNYTDKNITTRDLLKALFRGNVNPKGVLSGELPVTLMTQLREQIMDKMLEAMEFKELHNLAIREEMRRQYIIMMKPWDTEGSNGGKGKALIDQMFDDAMNAAEMRYEPLQVWFQDFFLKTLRPLLV
jgi:hypothetical protein